MMGLSTDRRLFNPSALLGCLVRGMLGFWEGEPKC